MIEYVEDDLPLPPFDEIFTNFSSNKFIVKSQSRSILISSPEIYSSSCEQPYSSSIKKTNRSARPSTAGRWKSEEHQLFLQGVQLYGREWKKMQPLIKTRSIVQIRTHAQKVFKKDVLNIKSRLAATATEGIKEVSRLFPYFCFGIKNML